MKTKVRGAFLAILSVPLMLGPAHASMTSFGFSCITFDDPDNCAIGETQLILTGPDDGLGLNMGLFTIANSGPDAPVVDAVSGISDFVGPTEWSGLFKRDSINTPGQFGLFDIAGITGMDLGGGNPNVEIPRGLTPSSFEFTLFGPSLNLPDTSSFLDLFSFEQEGPQFFIARFQRTGADQQRSDLAIPGEASPPPVFPEPGTLLLTGSGLVGLGAGVRRRRKHH